MVGRSQSKRVKPTHTDPEDDQAADSALPSGSTSTTGDLCADNSFGLRSRLSGELQGALLRNTQKTPDFQKRYFGAPGLDPSNFGQFCRGIGVMVWSMAFF